MSYLLFFATFSPTLNIHIVLYSGTPDDIVHQSGHIDNWSCTENPHNFWSNHHTASSEQRYLFSKSPAVTPTWCRPAWPENRRTKWPWRSSETFGGIATTATAADGRETNNHSKRSRSTAANNPAESTKFVLAAAIRVNWWTKDHSSVELAASAAAENCHEPCPADSTDTISNSRVATATAATNHCAE